MVEFQPPTGLPSLGILSRLQRLRRKPNKFVHAEGRRRVLALVLRSHERPSERLSGGKPGAGVFWGKVGKPNYLPRVKNKVRVTSTKGLWLLEEQNDGLVKVMYQQYADPGGGFPNWIIKFYSVSIPYKALTRLRAQVKWEKYKSQIPSGIIEEKTKPTNVSLPF